MPRGLLTLQNHPKSKVLNENYNFGDCFSYLMVVTLAENSASTALLLFFPLRCKAQGTICCQHAEEEKVMFLL